MENSNCQDFHSKPERLHERESPSSRRINRSYLFNLRSMEEQGNNVWTDDSPIEEVRLTVPPTDDTTLPVLTFRTWIIGIPICILQSVVGRLGSFRQQYVYFAGACVNIILLGLGKLLAKVLPNKIVKFPLTPWKVSLNPGPFNIKEHVLLATLVSWAPGDPGFDTVAISKIFYHREIKPLPALLLAVTTQLLGFGFTGVYVKLLVDSPYMWWPSTLADVSFFRALHEEEKREKGKVSRYQFFLIVAIASFAYSIVPTYLFPSITALSAVCWIWNKSVTAQQIGSALHGLGIGSVMLDWVTITTFLGNPLVVPTFVLLNTTAGVILIAYILLPIFYWNNIYSAKSFPLSSSGTFDDRGQLYDVSRVLNLNTLTFNEKGYRDYSGVYFSVKLALCYGFIFASITSSISYIVLFHGRSIWEQFRKTHGSKHQDVHSRLMKQNYKSIPQWWFYSILVSTIGLAIVLCQTFGDQIQLRYWEILLLCALLFIFLFPQGVLSAIAATSVPIEFLFEILIGYLNPGKPIANMAFKTFAWSAINTVTLVTRYLKLSHYMKIPPRTTFLVQLISAMFSGLFDFCMAWWMIYSIDNICQPDLLPPGSPWTCPGQQLLYTFGVTWGLVGPTRMLYPHGTYFNIFIVCSLLGLILPFSLWVFMHKYPNKKWIGKINLPIIFSVSSFLAVAAPAYIWSWLALGLTFNYYIYHWQKEWWARYNYVLSAALTTGAAFLLLLLSLSLQFQDFYGVSWWGLELDDHCPLAKCPTAPGIIVSGCPIIK